MIIKLLEPLGVPSALIEKLASPLEKAGHEFVYYKEKTTDTKELAERSKDADIVMIANNPYPKEAFQQAKNLKLINVAFTGVDHVDQEAAKAQNIQIANAAGYSNTAVAELVLGLTLDVLRKISFGNQSVRLGEEVSIIQGNEIKGKTVGIIGTGNIGLETARLFKAFGAKLIGYNRSEKEAAKELELEYLSLEDVLQRSDIVSVHLPLNNETTHLLSKEKLTLMKPEAILINAARGPIIDNEALAELLNEEKIAGAGIDVFDEEPPLFEDYPLLTAKNTVLTPHVGYLTDEAMVTRAHIAFENVEKYLAGNPQNIIQ
ncbi:MAG TPA: hydroxyacid dehydrogenase [Candidatus Atopostipes pullistercoris]|uniref:Hydroxyacid dehydrogenase n=1 Tax=Candidatus Atopostipes pullistercoris TaxID=2838467 RepID=A0A9D2G1Y1_9LACT|nr:hydroxyacid dehydrogenase [Candidatus Atopostipes pullistercoris]